MYDLGLVSPRVVSLSNCAASLVDDLLESDEWSPVPSSLLFLPCPAKAAVVEALPWKSSSDSSCVRRLLMCNTGISSNISRKELWRGRRASGQDDEDRLGFVLAAVRREL